MTTTAKTTTKKSALIYKVNGEELAINSEVITLKRVIFQINCRLMNEDKDPKTAIVTLPNGKELKFSELKRFKMAFYTLFDAFYLDASESESSIKALANIEEFKKVFFKIPLNFNSLYKSKNYKETLEIIKDAYKIAKDKELIKFNLETLENL